MNRFIYIAFYLIFDLFHIIKICQGSNQITTSSNIRKLSAYNDIIKRNNSLIMNRRYLKSSQHTTDADKYKNNKNYRKDSLYNDNPYIIELRDDSQHDDFVNSNAKNNFVIVNYYGKFVQLL